MKLMKIEIIFLFLLAWIGTTISRSPTKPGMEDWIPNTKKMKLDLSSEKTDPKEVISRAFTAAMEQFKSQIRAQQPVIITWTITTPPGTREDYVENIERIFRNLIRRTIMFPTEGFVSTEVKSSADGTIPAVTITVSLVSPKKAVEREDSPNAASVLVDLSKPGVEMEDMLKRALSLSVSGISTRYNGNQSNDIKLRILPPSGSTRSNVHTIIARVEYVLLTLSPDTDFGIKTSLSEDTDGTLIDIRCVINIHKFKPKHKNTFDFEIDPSKTGLNESISSILKGIQPEIDIIFNENRPVFLKLTISPSPKATKESLSLMANNIVSILDRVYPNRIDGTANVYQNPKGEITSLVVGIVIQPENVIEVDLSANNAVDQVKSAVISYAPTSKPNSFTLLMKSPEKPDPQVLENVMHLLSSTISQRFPENEQRFQVKQTKDARGTVTKTTIVVTIKPNSEKNTKKIITVDLTKPGNDLKDRIIAILPSLKNAFNKENPEPVTLTVNIVPPKESDEDIVQKSLSTVIVILSETFPLYKIQSEASVRESPKSFIEDMKLVFTINPQSCMEEKMVSKSLTINLDDSVSELVPKLSEILPNINELVETGQTANIKLDIQPPTGSNEETVKRIVRTIVTVLTKLYPYNKIGFQVKIVKDQKDNIDDVAILITIEPVDEKPSKKSPPEIININIVEPKQGITKQILDILPTLTTATDKLKKGVPVEINFNIKPPKGTSIDEVKKTANSVLTAVSKVYPQDKVSVRAKITRTERKIIKTFVVTIRIEPEPDEEATTETPTGTTMPKSVNQITLDLSKPGTNVNEKISITLTEIKKERDRKPKGEKPDEFTLNITPPEKSDETFVKKTVNTLTTTLQSLFPYEKITVSMNISKKPDDTISNIEVYIKISPKKPTSKVHEIIIDLSKPGTDIVKVIKPELLKIKPEVDKSVPEKPTTLKFDIEPPKDSTEESLRKTVDVITTTITEIFPEKEITVKLNIRKDSEGNIKHVTMFIELEPSKPKPTTINPETDDSGTTKSPGKKIEFEIDLSKPKSDINEEVRKILPNVQDEIVRKHPKGKQVDLDLKIKPPTNATKPLVQKTIKSIVDIFTEVYPKNEMKYKVKLEKHTKDIFSKITITLTIMPSKDKKYPWIVDVQTDSPSPITKGTTQTTSSTSTPSSKEPKETTFTIDLTKPGTKMIPIIEEIIPKISPNIKPKLDKNKPVTLTFDIQPPEDSDDKYPKETTEKLVTTLSKFFPDDVIKAKTKITKKPNGKPDKITVDITIEPTTSQDKIGTTPETSATEESTSTPTTKTPRETTFTIDLTKPGTKLIPIIEEIIPKISPNIKPKLDKNKPVTLTFDIQPPEDSDDKYPKETTEKLVTTLSKFFPDDVIKAKTKITKKPNGEPDKITVDITIEPTTSQDTVGTTPETSATEESTSTPTTKTPKETTFTIDLTKPGTKLVPIIEEIIPKISPNIKPKLDKNKPVTLTFDIQPPEDSDDKYPKETTEKLVTTLSKFFPDDVIKAKTKITKKPNGKPDKITVDITIEPTTSQDTIGTTPETSATEESTSTPTTKTPRETTFTIDLTKPGTKLIPIIEEIIPKISPNIKPKLDKNKPVTLTFDIQPPEDSDDKYPKETTEKLVTTLSKFFPDDVIKAKTKITKKPNGKPDKITVDITIEPTTSQDTVGTTPETSATEESTSTPTTKTPKETTFTIDLTKPGTKLVPIIEEIIPKISPNIKPKLDKNKPVTLTFDIQPPEDSDDKYPKETTEKLVTTLSKFFPDDVIKAKTKITKKPNGKPDKITIDITIEPTTSQDTVGTTPGTSRTDESEQTTPSTVESKETKGSTPGTSRTEESGLTTPSTDESKENTSPASTSTPSTKTPKETTFTIDLTKPGTKLIPIIEEIIPKISPNIKPKLDKNKPVTLTFDIQPPEDSDDKYPKETTEKLVTTLSKFFPDDVIKAKTKITKKPNGKPDKITVDITIEPTTSQDTVGTTPETSATEESTSTPTTKTPRETTFTIDLTKPGTKLIPIIEEIIPKISPNIKPKLDKNKPVTLTFDIQPPEDSDDKYPKETTEKLVTTLSKFFPDDVIKAKTKITKKPNGKPDKITVDITIEPTTSQDTIGTTPETSATEESTSTPTTKTPKETTFTIDLTKPGTKLIPIIEEIIPKISPNIKPKLDKNKPVTLTFDIQPPEDSDDKYPKETTEKLVTTLSKFFPDDVIKAKTKITKKPNGKPDKITVDITIEPTTSQDTIGTTPETSATEESTSTPTTKTPKETTFTIDLTKPGTKLIPIIEEIIPKISPNIKPKLDKNKPVTLTFDIQPPEDSDDKYPKETTEKLVTTLSKFFPDDVIKAKTKITKKPNGKPDKITVDITIEPTTSQDKIGTTPETSATEESTSTPTTKTPKETTFTIDLTKPGTKLVPIIEEIIPKISPNIKPKLDKNKPVTLTFDIQPPEDSDDKYPKETTEKLVTTLSKFFPDDVIKAKTKITKKPNGKPDKITVDITIEPTTSQDTIGTTPETSATEESTSTPTTKTPRETTFTIDLTKPGTKLIPIIEEIIPKISPNIKPKLDKNKPVTLTFDIQPPEDSDDKYPKETTEKLVTTLSKFFPDDVIKAKTKITKKPNGKPDKITVDITIEPTTSQDTIGTTPETSATEESTSTPTTKTPKETTFTIDLTKPGTKLIPIIEEIIPKISPNIKPKLDKNKPVTLTFDIQPPEDSDDKYPKETTEKLVTTLSKFFPDDVIKAKTKITKKPNGKPDKITVDITIEPTTSQDKIGTTPETSATEESTSTPTTKTPKETTFTIDLTKPGTKLVPIIEEIIPKISPNIKPKLDKNKPVTLTFDIQPPEDSDDKYPKETTEKLVTTLSKFFPDDVIKAKTKITKKPNGKPDKITFDITIEPTTSQDTVGTTPETSATEESTSTPTTKTPKETTFTIDLTKPGTKLVPIIEEIIPKISPNIKPKLDKNKPVTLTFDIQPPEDSDDKYPKETTEKLVTTLSKFFPDDVIKAKTKITKKPNGKPDKITIDITIEPTTSQDTVGTTPETSATEESTSTPTTKTPKETTFTIDLTKPGTKLVPIIEEIIPKISPNIKPKLDKNKPVTLTFDIQPPEDSDDKYPKETTEKLVTTLSKFFPDDVIKAKTKITKKPNGKPDKITIDITIEPTTSQDTVGTTPGTSRTDESEQTTPSTVESKETKGSTPGTSRTEESGLTTPSTDESKENTSPASTSTPSTKTPKETTFTIDLTKPGTKLIPIIEEIIPKISPNIKPKLDKNKPVTLTFDIQPPEDSDDKYPKETTEKLVTTLSKFFPDDVIKAKTKITKKPNGKPDKITVDITIEPTTSQDTIGTTPETSATEESTSTPTTKTPKETTFTIDLTKPGTKLIPIIEEIIPKISPNIKPKLDKNKPVTLTFDIQPPEDSDDKYPKETTEKLVTTLSKFFPDDVIKAKTKITKKPNGKPDKITIDITIEPTTSQDTVGTTPETSATEESTSTPTTKTPKETTFTIDLTKPGTKLVPIIEEIIPKISPNIKPKLDKNKPVTLTFDIQPPEDSDDKYPKETTEKLVTTLSKFFPDDVIKAKTKITKKPNGKPDKITVDITIEPTTSQDTIGTTPETSATEESTSTPTTKTPKETTFTIDLTKPGTKLIPIIEEIIPKISPNIKPKLDKNKPVTLTFDIQPPEDSDDKYPKETTEKLVTTLSKFFPDDVIKAKTKITKKPNGKPDKITIDITIEPTTSQDTVGTTPGTSRTDESEQTTPSTVESKETKGSTPGTSRTEESGLTTPSTDESKENTSPASTSTPSTKTPKETTFTIDLTKPGTKLIPIIEEIIPKISPNIKPKLDKNKPVTLTFDIQPPEDSDDKYPKETTEKLVTTLSKFFPDDVIKAKTKITKKPNGKPDKITVDITIEPTTSQDTIGTTPETSATEESTSTPTTKTPKETTFTIDLTKPGTKLIPIIEEIIPKISPNIKPKLDKNKPVTLTFDIQPPEDSDDKYPKETTEKLVTTLSKFFPDDVIKAKTKITKKPNGKPDKITIDITIEPTTSQDTVGTTPETSATEESTSTPTTKTPKETTFTIDLTKPGTKLVPIIEEIIPKISPNIKPKLDKNKPVTLTFDIQPPEDSDDKYPKETTEKLVTTLSKFFPDDVIKAKTKITKKPNGKPDKITVDITIEPTTSQDTIGTTPETSATEESTSTPTTKTPKETTFTIDLTKPGTKLIPIIEEIIPKISPNIKPKLDKNKPVTLTFDIQPPEDSDDKYPKETTEKLVTTLSKFFPDDVIKAKTKITKKPNGKPDKITIDITIEPTTSQDTVGTTPGTSKTDESEQTTPSTVESKETKGSTPGTSRTEESGLTTPSTDESKENTSPASTSTPSTKTPKETTFTIDLTKPGTKLIPIIEEIIPKISPNIKPKLDKNKPVTLTFDIQPPEDSDDKYPKETTEKLVTTLSKFFPDDVIKAKTKITKKPNGKPDKITIDITIEPTTSQDTVGTTPETSATEESTSTPTTKTPKETTFTIDLTKPGTKLVPIIEEIIPKISPNIKPKLDKNKPVTLTFDIQPPEDSDDKYPKETTEKLVTTLSKFFPDDVIKAKTKITKKPNGKPDKITIDITIEPTTSQDTVGTTPGTSRTDESEQTTPSTVESKETKGSTPGTSRTEESGLTTPSTDESKENTSPASTSTPSTKTPKETTFTIDLTKPGTKLIPIIEEIIPKISPNIKPKLDKNKPVTLTFDIQPPEDSDDKYPKETTEKLVTTLSKFFPDDVIKAKTKITKKPNGKPDKITVDITIEPTTSQDTIGTTPETSATEESTSTPTTKTPKETTFTIDLTKPGTKLIPIIEEIIPKISPNIKPKLDKNKPVTLTFDIQPPEDSDDKYPKETTEKLVTTLSKFFPDDVIKAKTKITKKPNGKPDKITIDITIEPTTSQDTVGTTPETSATEESTSTPTTKTPKETTFTIDLTKPGTKLVPIIEEIIPKISPNIKPKLDKNKPVTLTFDIQPPEDSDDKYPKETTEKLVTTLSKFFPDDVIKAKTKITKKPNGKPDKITVDITIEPTTSQDTIGTTPETSATEESTSTPTTKTPKETTFTIDLTKPGTKLIPIIEEIIPKISPNIKPKLDKNKPVTLTFDIQPPEDSDDKYPKETTEKLVTTLSKFFPDDVIKAKTKITKKPNGKPDKITIDITIEPTTSQDTVGTTPGTSRTDESEQTTPSTVESKETKGSTPGTSRTEESGLTTPSTDESKENTSPASTSTPSTKTPKETTFTIDLTKPGTKLIPIIEEIIPKISPNIKPKLDKNKPVTLTFDIQPPEDSDDKYPKETTEKLVTTLSKFFPDDVIKAKTKITKKPNGKPDKITVDITIEPTTSQDTIGTTPETSATEESTSTPTTKTPKETTFTIDLTKPGTKLIPIIEEIIPKISPNIKPKLDKNKPVTLTFDIQPPEDSDDKYPKETTEKLVTTLSKFFPDDVIKAKTKITKKPNGKPDKITIDITIEPTTSQDTVGTTPETSATEESTSTPTTKTPKETTFTIDLTKPGTKLVPIIEEIIPKISPNIKPKLDKNKPVTLTFDIQPPEDSDDKYPKETTEKLVTTLSKFFPDDVIKAKTKITKKPNGKPDKITVDITIEPTTSQDTIGTTPETSATEESTSTPTTKTPKETTFTIDLTKPGTKLIPIIEEIIPKISPNIKPKLDKNKPVTLTFDIQPPEDSDDKYPKETTEKLVTTLSKFFPDDVIKAKTKITKKPNGKPDKITIDITIEPTTSQDTVGTTPGTSRTDESEQTTPSTVESKETKGSTPGTSRTEESGLTTPSTDESKENTSPASTSTPSTKTPKETTFTIDLTKPGTKLIPIIEEIIPKISPNIKPKLDKNKPVTLTFDIQPPEDSDDKYPKETTEKLVTTLSKFFPDDVIKAKTKITKKPNGKPDKITVDITIEPTTSQDTIGTTPETSATEESTSTPTTKTPKETTFTIDLTKPGTKLIPIIEEIIPKISPNIKPKLDKNKPVTLTFDIQPPEDSDDKYPKETTEKLVTTLSKFFPDDVIKAKTKITKKPNGKPDKITIDITIEPTTSQDTVGTTPGTSRTDESEQTTPSTVESKETKGSTPGTSRTEESGLTTPSTDESKENTSPASTSTPSTKTPKETTFTIDLTKPGTKLVPIIEEIIPKISPNIKPKLDKNKPVTLTFDIQPPEDSDDKYPKETTEKLLTTLSKFFPDDVIKAKTKISKKPNGKPDKITVDITIEPSIEGNKKTPSISTTPTTVEEETFSDEEINKWVTGVNWLTTPSEIIDGELTDVTESPQKSTPKEFTTPSEGLTESTTPSEGKETTITIDLSKPATNLEDSIEKIIPKIDTISDDKKPVRLTFKIKPPTGTDPSNLDDIPKKLITILVKYYPDKKISIRTKAKKDNKGFITEIITEIILRPTTSKKPQDQTVDVDLSKPGTSLQEEVINIIPGLVPKVQKELKKNKPGTLTFTIKPPNKSTNRDLKPMIETLTEILSKFFPKNKIEVQLDVKKNPEDYLTEVTVNVVILPSDKPKPEVVDIDLTKPGETFVTQVEKILPKIIPTIKKPLKKNKPVTIYFTIKPSPGLTVSYIPVIKKTLESILKQYFPGSTIIIDVKTKKDSQDYLTDIVVETTIQPKPTITIDLKESDTTLHDQVKNKLPTVMKHVKDKLNKREPVTLSFEIKPPPKSTVSYLQELTKSLVNILTKYFPDNKIKATVKAQKDPDGYITDVTIDINIEPSSTVTTVYIDLKDSDTSLHDQVKDKLPTVMKHVKDKLNKKQPVTLSFKIKPPSESTESYLQDLTKSLVNILTKYFPDNKIKATVKAQKDSDDYITDVTVDIIIEPPSTLTTVYIDLKDSDSPLHEQVRDKLPKVMNHVKNKLNKKQPVTLSFKIKPPSESTESYLQDLTKSLVNILTKYFPDNKIKATVKAQKNPDGYITDVTIDINIEPSSTLTTVYIDLKDSDSPLHEQVRDKLPKVMNHVKNKLNKKQPVTLSFKIKPPSESTESYLQDLTKSLVNILTKYFPDNKIKATVKAQKNPDGYITDVTIDINIEPSSTLTTVYIDLKDSDSPLHEQVRDKLPKVMNHVKNKLNKKQPVTLSFKIKPPSESTESYLQDLTKSLVNILTQYFPDNKIKATVKAQKNPDGYITDVTIDINIEPSSTLTTVYIDLKDSDSPLHEQVRDKLPKVMNHVKNKLNKKQPVTLSFKIKPPSESTESYLQDLTKSLVNILTKYFPDNRIKATVKAQKNPDGYITDVTIDINIEPSSTLTTVYIDLKDSDSPLHEQVRDKLPKVMNHVKNKLNKKQPVTLSFKIKPPSESTESYLQDLTKSLVNILTKYFPDNKIKATVKAQKNPDGYITDVTIDINIEPSSTVTTVYINLKDSDTSLHDQVRDKIPTIMNHVRHKLDKQQPVTLSFKIKPPSESTESYLQDLTQSLVNILSKYFPDKKIKATVKAQKDSEGYITDVTVDIIIEPPSTVTTVYIDLKDSDSPLHEQVRDKLPTVMNRVKNKLDKQQPAILSFKIKPPSESTESYLQDLTKSLVNILTKYFPDNKIKATVKAQKDSDDYITTVTIDIKIEPVSTATTVYIDLKDSDTPLQDQVAQKMPKVMNHVKNKLNKKQPVTLSFKIKPPHGSTETYLQELANSLVDILKKYFPYNKINVSLNAAKDSDGYLTNVTIGIQIQPAATESPNEIKGFRVDIDLANPRGTLDQQVDTTIPNILPQIRSELDSGRSVALSFNVQPPHGSDSGYLQTFTQSLLPILSKYFPGNRMSIKTRASQDSDGYLSNIVVELTIVGEKVRRKDIDVDLTRPGSSLTEEVSNNIPSILPDVKNELANGRPVTLTLNVRPPAYSNRSFMRQIGRQVLWVMPQFFPHNRMGIKTSARLNSEGYLADMTLKVTIEA